MKNIQAFTPSAAFLALPEAKQAELRSKLEADVAGLSVASDEYRAYDTTTEWSGPVRFSTEAAEEDAAEHNAGCAAQGGYGSAIVVTHDPEAPSRLVDLGGESVWPPHGRSTGAARWR